MFCCTLCAYVLWRIMAAARGEVSSVEDDVEEKDVGGVPDRVKLLDLLLSRTGPEDDALEVDVDCGLDEEVVLEDFFFFEDDTDALLDDLL